MRPSLKALNNAACATPVEFDFLAVSSPARIARIVWQFNSPVEQMKKAGVGVCYNLGNPNSVLDDIFNKGRSAAIRRMQEGKRTARE